MLTISDLRSSSPTGFRHQRACRTESAAPGPVNSSWRARWPRLKNFWAAIIRSEGSRPPDAIEAEDFLDFPRPNITLHDELCPKNGVYAVTLDCMEKKYQGVANIGYSPTFDDGVFSIEVHILDFNENIYGHKIRCHFVQRIRDEIKFRRLPNCPIYQKRYRKGTQNPVLITLDPFAQGFAKKKITFFRNRHAPMARLEASPYPADLIDTQCCRADGCVGHQEVELFLSAALTPIFDDIHMKKNIRISLIFGGAVSVLALYLAFRNVPFDELSVYLASINYFWILPSVLVILISFALRAYRWKIILERPKISFWGAFHPLMIGFMMFTDPAEGLGNGGGLLFCKKRKTFHFLQGLRR